VDYSRCELSTFAGNDGVYVAELFRFEWFDQNELAHRAAVFEYDLAADLGEQGVVFAAADIKARLYAGAALADDDGASGDDLSAESFKSQSLRIRVAPVT
jgi:hypothetical protein